jgi:elongation factor G
MSLEPKKSSDRDKLGEIIGKLMREDPTFKAQTNEQTGELVIAGMGELHLEILTHRIIRDFNCDVVTGKPKVAYKQRLTRELDTEARYIRQSGGRGQYAVISVKFEPVQTEGNGFEFVDAIVGGSVPREYIPAVEKGLNESFNGGGRGTRSSTSARRSTTASRTRSTPARWPSSRRRIWPSARRRRAT